jgi:hypothetical protein
MPPARETWSRLTLRLLAHALVRPSVATALVRLAWRFRRRSWYRRPPFLPLPDTTYVRWRMYTAYGDSDAVPPMEDVVRYAHWATRVP